MVRGLILAVLSPVLDWSVYEIYEMHAESEICQFPEEKNTITAPIADDPSFCDSAC